MNARQAFVIAQATFSKERRKGVIFDDAIQATLERLVGLGFMIVPIERDKGDPIGNWDKGGGK